MVWGTAVVVVAAVVARQVHIIGQPRLSAVQTTFSVAAHVHAGSCGQGAAVVIIAVVGRPIVVARPTVVAITVVGVITVVVVGMVVGAVAAVVVAVVYADVATQ